MSLIRTFLAATLIMAGASARAEIPEIAVPDGEKFTWGQEPVVATGNSRPEVVLNGLWLFQPVTDGVPKDEWAAIRVPGSWDSQNEWDNMRMPSFIGTPPAWPGATFRTDKATQHVYLNQTARAWYERKITVPKDWARRKILLSFERISTDTEIFIDAQKAGETRWPGGDVDITSAIVPGTSATLRVKVTAVASEKELIIAMREDYADILLFDQYGGGGFGASGTPLSMRLELRKRPERASVHVPGFLTDKQMGDDPARYTRW